MFRENITIGEIAKALGVLGVIIGAYIKVKKSISNCYDTKVASKFKEIDRKFKEMDMNFKEIESRLEYIERKREEYEKEIGNSKEERSILMEGELSALKALRALLEENKSKHEEVGESIKRIEEYILEKSHD